MVEVAGSLRPVSIGAGVDDGGGIADGAVQAADGATFSGDSSSDVLHEVGGNSGNTGGAGSSNIGETGSSIGGSRHAGSRGDISRGAGGGEFDVGVGWEGGLAGDGMGDGGVLRLGGGEKRNSLLLS